MAEYHLEEYLYLGGLTHKTAIIAWGGFFFKVKDSGSSFKLVDDGDLDHVFPPRHETIGERSEPYGPAEVRVFDVARGELCGLALTETANHVEITGLRSDTEYRYEVRVKGELWADGELRDWTIDAEGRAGLLISGKRYDNRFRTLPHVTEPAIVTFAVLGDFGTGVRKPSKSNSRQREVAEALEAAVDTHDVRVILTTGDNIYARKKLAGVAIGGQGDEDDDWFFTYYQPYRYVINRVPVLPTIGNHDSGESEFENDDRTQVYDNLFIRTRFAGEVAANRAVLQPGLFYRLRCGRDVEFVAIDTSKASIVAGHRLFQEPAHRAFMDDAFLAPAVADSPRWKIPFFHHPPYSAGPNHDNSLAVINDLVKKYFVGGGVRVMFAGHEHNFQHTLADDLHCFVTGSAGKNAEERPKQKRFATAHAVSWSGEPHFLLVTIEDKQLTVWPIGGAIGGKLTHIGLEDANGRVVSTPIEILI